MAGAIIAGFRKFCTALGLRKAPAPRTDKAADPNDVSGDFVARHGRAYATDPRSLSDEANVEVARMKNFKHTGRR